MKKVLWIVGIVCLSVCGISLLFGIFNRFGYYSVLDGDPELYARLHQRMTIGFAAAAVLAVIGVVCFGIYAKI